MPRILVTGASGLLGLNLALSACERHQVTGVDRARLAGVPFSLVCADLLDPGTTDRIIESARPDWMIHCAALANLEVCEADPGQARRLNADLPGEMATACAQHGVRMVHISTDSIFDGTRDELLTETDAPSPIGVYPVTKLQGEQAVLNSNPDAIVARVNFFGWSLSGRRSISEFFYNNLSASRRCNGFKDVWFCSMFVGDLADTLLWMLEKGLSGLYHATGSEAMTKYDFGVRLARRFGFDETLIDPISVEQSGLTAKRAHHLRLSVHKLSTALGAEIPGVSTGLDRFYTQFQQGFPQKIHNYQQV